MLTYSRGTVEFDCTATLFAVGAGDGNRTRTVSLGIRHGPAIHAPWPDLTWSRVISLDPGLLHADCTTAANARSVNLMLSYRVQPQSAPAKVVRPSSTSLQLTVTRTLGCSPG